MTTIGIARTLMGVATRHRTIERRFGNWTVLLDLAPANWTAGLWIDGPPAIHVWLGPVGFGVAQADPDDERRWDCAWTLARVTVSRTEFRLEADLNIWQFGVAFARGWRDFGIYLGPLNIQVELDICWHDPRANPLLRLLVPPHAPNWSILSRPERAAALEQAIAGQLDLVRFAPADTGLDRPIWIGRGVEVVVLPRRPGVRAAIDCGCVAVGVDQDTGYRDADRWLEVNAYLLRKLSAGLIDGQDFLTFSRRSRNMGFFRAR